MNSRSIPFEKISNARDLGGLRTVQGHVIAPGHLLRSANLAGATEADRRLLQERYRLAKIIDLRTQAERDEKPDAVIEDSDNLPIPIFDVATAGISHERENRQDRDMLCWYRRLLQLRREQPGILRGDILSEEARDEDGLILITRRLNGQEITLLFHAGEGRVQLPELTGKRELLSGSSFDGTVNGITAMVLV